MYRKKIKQYSIYTYETQVRSYDQYWLYVLYKSSIQELINDKMKFSKQSPYL